MTRAPARRNRVSTRRAESQLCPQYGFTKSRKCWAYRVRRSSSCSDGSMASKSRARRAPSRKSWRGSSPSAWPRSDRSNSRTDSCSRLHRLSRHAPRRRGKAAKPVEEEAPKPRLGPPRLIKAAKAAKQAADADAVDAEAAESTAAPDVAEPLVEVEKVVEETSTAPVPVTKGAPRSVPRLRSLRIENEAPKPPQAPEPVETTQPVASEPVEAHAAPSQQPIPEPPAKTEEKPAIAAAPPEAQPAAPASPPSPPAPAATKRAGRFVPPTLRLRVEETKPRLPRPPVVTRVIQLPTRTPAGRPPLGGPRPLPSAAGPTSIGAACATSGRIFVRRHDHIDLPGGGPVPGQSSRRQSSRRRRSPERSRLPRA